MPTAIWTAQTVNVLSSNVVIGAGPPQRKVIIEVGADAAQDFGGGTVDLLVSRAGITGKYFVDDSITAPKAMEITPGPRGILFSSARSPAGFLRIDGWKSFDPQGRKYPVFADRDRRLVSQRLGPSSSP